MKLPITKPYFDEKELEAISQVLQSGWVVQGPKTEEFERLFAGFVGVGFAKAVTSCTTALHLALLASSIREGDDVIIPSFTFIATANAVEYTGATPVFCDIDIRTFNISVNGIKDIIEQRYTKTGSAGELINKVTGNRLKAIIPVHLFGLPADMEQINEVAKQYELIVIEDAACAIGAFINGKHVGSYGNLTCFSFHPRKAITTGEGGMITTDNETNMKLIEALRSHGATVSDLTRHSKSGYLLPEYNYLGYNYRMTDLQGAIGVEQMKKLSFVLERRKQLADRYNERLIRDDKLIKPFVPKNYTHGYQSYVCMINPEGMDLNSIEKANHWRNSVMEELEREGIATRQGTHAVHTLGYYKNKYSMSDEQFINSYAADRLTLSIPLYTSLGIEEQDYIIQKIEGTILGK